MKQTVVFAVLAIGAGILGGAIFGRLSRPAAPAEPPRAPRAEFRLPAVIVPPGWDPKLVERVGALEHRLDVAQSKDSRPTDSAEPQNQQVADREAERAAQYQKELDYRARIIAEHDSEPLDSAWAGPESDQIKRDFALKMKPGSKSVGVEAIDCRSKTCTARLSFPTPLEGLQFVQQGPAALMVSGCNGYSSVPPPPTGEGRYEVTVVYTCR